MSVYALVVIAFTIEAFLHYFPWRLVFKKELPRIIAYTLGVLGILLPFSAWLYEQGYTQVLFTLWITTVSAGASVCLWYLVDWLLERINTASEAHHREIEARTRLQDSHHVES